MTKNTEFALILTLAIPAGKEAEILAVGQFEQ